MNGTWALVVSILAGAVLLFFGRFLYWVYVGVMGFALGFAVGAAIVGTTSGWTEILVGAGVGVVAALLSLVLQKPMAALAGFLVAGGAAVFVVDAWLKSPGTTLRVLTFVLVGILGAILAWALFEPVLILFTSLAGAGIITNAIDRHESLDPLWLTVILGASTVVGMIVQSSLVARKRRGRGGRSRR